MEEKTIKRSIRIPLRVHEVLSKESARRGKSVNQVILEDLGSIYGIEVGNRKRRKEMVIYVSIRCNARVAMSVV